MVLLKNIYLEETTKAFIDKLAAKNEPPLSTLTPTEARTVLEQIQASVEKIPINFEDKLIPNNLSGEISIRIYRPLNVTKKLPIIMYFHGGGWILGSVNTHDRLVRELSIGTEAAVVFVNYTRSPEAKYPLAIEEAYTATKYIVDHASEFNLDHSRLAIAGDSVGGNMAIAVALLAKERYGFKIAAQILLYPVTSASFNTFSYQEFAEGPWLTKSGMEWFWNAYEPNAAERKKALISPLYASIEELKGLPTTLIITAENDVLRDEGEEFAHRLMQANVNVTATRFLGTIHDFMMLNALVETAASRGAINLVNTYLQKIFYQSSN